VAYRWWQGLGLYSLRVMEAAAQAKRHAKEQGRNNEFMSMHSEIPSLADETLMGSQSQRIITRTVPCEERVSQKKPQSSPPVRAPSRSASRSLLLAQRTNGDREP
jgi:hypothetical protein